jgi:peroxiredoxin
MTNVVGFAQKKDRVWSAQEKPIFDQIRTLRNVPDDARADVTKKLARDIRELPAAQNRVDLALGLASLSTEGDFGHDTLQVVADTLASALKDTPQPDEKREPSYAYTELAQLVRYENCKTDLQAPAFSAAIAKLEQTDRVREQADFELTDLSGKTWSLKSLKGKVVVVNFWATWCPPCRKELPDLQALFDKYKNQGLVVLAISDEDKVKVQQFVQDRKISYPILLDSGRKVEDSLGIEGIPKTFLYDRSGKLVAQAIDMRTRNQFQQMLAKAGMQ